MVPLSMWLMEEVEKTKKALVGLIITGSALSLFYAICLVFYDVTPQINNFHIQYVDSFPRTYADIAFVFYPIPTILPLFISSVR